MKNQKLKMKNFLFGLAIALGVVGFINYGSINVYADDNSGKYPPIVQKLVERFGLNEDEVKAVFDEAREEHKAEMQTRLEERLNQAVIDGKITQEQKEAILAKKAEMHINRENLKDLSPEERRKKMATHKEEIKTWAEQNGIDLKGFFGGMGMRGGHFGMKNGRFDFGQ